MEDAHAKSADEVRYLHIYIVLHDLRGFVHCSKGIFQVCRFFNTGPEGLSDDQVEKLREKYGLNGELQFYISVSFHAKFIAH